LFFLANQSKPNHRTEDTYETHTTSPLCVYGHDKTTRNGGCKRCKSTCCNANSQATRPLPQPLYKSKRAGED
jgi:hypothetical protein